MGFGFAAGTTDGPGAFDFKQEDAKGNPFWRLVRDVVKTPGKEQVECQSPKPIPLATGEMNIPYDWAANHRLTTNVQRRIYGHATDVEIRPLNEEKAVKAASELIGELFIFTVAGIALLFEWQRSSSKEARKEEIRKQEMEAIRQREEDLSKEVELLKIRLVDIENLTKACGLGGVFHFRNAQPEAAVQTPEAA